MNIQETIFNYNLFEYWLHHHYGKPKSRVGKKLLAACKNSNNKKIEINGCLDSGSLEEDDLYKFICFSGQKSHKIVYVFEHPKAMKRIFLNLLEELGFINYLENIDFVHPEDDNFFQQNKSNKFDLIIFDICDDFLFVDDKNSIEKTLNKFLSLLNLENEESAFIKINYDWNEKVSIKSHKSL